MKPRRSFFSCVLTGLTALVLGSAASAQDAYVIGISADLSGPSSGISAPVALGLRAYLDQVNTKGGINGHAVKVILQDNQSNPAVAGNDSRKLLTEDRAVLLIGSSLSSTYTAMVKEAKAANVPLYFAGGVCPKETYPPADPLQFCSTAFAANLDTQAALQFIASSAKEPVRLGLGGAAIPIARAELDYAEKLATSLGMAVAAKEVMPPQTVDYGPLVEKLRAATPNWIYAWSPWLAEKQIHRSLRDNGWKGPYIAWAHSEAEDDLVGLKDGEFFIIGANALFQDDVPIQAEIRALAQRADLKFPVTQLTEGYIAGVVVEEVLKNTPWPATPAKVLAAMNRLKVDLKGLRGGPLEWTAENHFRTRQYYRVWRWDPSSQRLRRVQDWVGVDVKR